MTSVRLIGQFMGALIPHERRWQIMTSAMNLDFLALIHHSSAERLLANRTTWLSHTGSRLRLHEYHNKA